MKGGASMAEPFDDDTPALPMWASIEREASYTKADAHSRYVAPYQRRDVPAAPVIDIESFDVGGVWDSRSATVQEVGTPVHRAVATLIRSAPVVVLMMLLGIPLARFVWGGWDWWFGIATVGCLGLAGTLGVLLIDLSWNAPGSTERHRINKAHDLKRMQLRQNHELRRDIVDAYLDQLERKEKE